MKDYSFFYDDNSSWTSDAYGQELMEINRLLNYCSEKSDRGIRYMDVLKNLDPSKMSIFTKLAFAGMIRGYGMSNLFDHGNLAPIQRVRANRSPNHWEIPNSRLWGNELIVKSLGEVGINVS